MYYLLSGGPTKVRQALPTWVGGLLEPKGRNSSAPYIRQGRPWAIDNGAYSGFDPAAFRSLLAREHGNPGCLWVAAPDVVGDYAATLRLFAAWESEIHRSGWPVALVAQDGLLPEHVPWESIEALFIGGSTHWKLDIPAMQLVRAALDHGKRVHMGRVNSARRYIYAKSIGVQSVDGTGLTRFWDDMSPRIERQLDNHQQHFQWEVATDDMGCPV